MAYIGTKPTIGNFQICDAISVVNGQAAYTMQVGGVNVSPQSSNHMIVSLNGTIQKPGGANPSFTVSGSTITFASNLATGDVIDFIQILGDVLDLGVPSDATVSTAKIVDDAVTAAKINNDIISGSTELATTPADTDEFLVSDAGTLKRIDYSLIKAEGITTADMWRLTTDFQSGTGAFITSNLERADTDGWSVLGTGMSESSGVFTFPEAGYYLISYTTMMTHISGGMARSNGASIFGTVDNSNYTEISRTQTSFDGNTDGVSFNHTSNTILFDCVDTSTHKVKFDYFSSDGNITLKGSTSRQDTGMTFVRLAGT
jgi:hypothetical protein